MTAENNTTERQPIGRGLTVLFLTAGGIATLMPLWTFISGDGWPQHFEIGFHHLPMRAWGEWLERGQTIGWDHTFSNGYPIYQFYFPAPALGWMLLNVFLPAHTAYILVTVLPVPGLLWAVFWLARTFGLGRGHAVLLGCSAVVAWSTVNFFGLRFYGLPSIMYGIFGHAWAVVAGVCFLAVCNRVLTADPGRAVGTWVGLAGLLLGLCLLSHSLIGVMVGVAVVPFGWWVWKRLALVFALAVGLTAWWWFPAVAQHNMSAHRHLAVLPWDQVFSPAHLIALPVASLGVWRLFRSTEDRRRLIPWGILAVGGLAHRLVISDGDAFHAGGRTLTFWHLSVFVVAVWTVSVLTVDLLRRWPPTAYTTGVLLLIVAYATAFNHASLASGSYDGNMPRWKNGDQAIADNHDPLPHCAATVGDYRQMRPSTFLDGFLGGWWSPVDGCRLYMLNGLSTRAFGKQHRQTHTTLAESSPTHYFVWEVFHATTEQFPDPTRYGYPPLWSPVDWDRAAGQMMTLGVDFYRTRADHPPPPGDSPWVHTYDDRWGPVITYRIVAPPSTWETRWDGSPPREWLRRSLHEFTTWDGPDDVTIVVRGSRPDSRHNPDEVMTVRPDWSDNDRVAFGADRAGLFYVPVSYHPNWRLETPGDGPWQAGPNQMVVLVDRPGRIVMRFVSSGWERLGQAVTALTVVVWAALAVAARRRIRNQNR